VRGRRSLRHVEVDTNWWKTFVHERLATAMGDRGCLSLWGRRPERHRLFAEHLTAEYRVRTEGRGRTVDEWKLPPPKPDNPACDPAVAGEQTGREPGGRVPKGCDAGGAHNHWLDCIVGCGVAASMQGVEHIGAAVQARAKEKKRLKLSDLQHRVRQ